MLIVITIFSFVMFGITGIRVVFGIILLSSPFYVMLGSLKLTEGEKYVFSVLLGLTIFPSLVYLLGLVISFKIAIFAVFAALMGMAIAKKYINRVKIPKGQEYKK